MSALATDRLEAAEWLFEVVRDLIRDGRGTAHLSVDDLTAAEFDEAPGFLTGARSKLERIGAHAIEYRKGDDQ